MENRLGAQSSAQRESEPTGRHCRDRPELARCRQPYGALLGPNAPVGHSALIHFILMKEYQPSEFFVLRTPLLPFGDFLQLSEDLQAPKVLEDSAAASDCTLREQAAASHRQKVRSRLRVFVALPVVKEALWLASPDFVTALAQCSYN